MVRKIMPRPTIDIAIGTKRAIRAIIGDPAVRLWRIGRALAVAVTATPAGRFSVARLITAGTPVSTGMPCADPIGMDRIFAVLCREVLKLAGRTVTGLIGTPMPAADQRAMDREPRTMRTIVGRRAGRAIGYRPISVGRAGITSANIMNGTTSTTMDTA
jgi:hypothetical protein